MPESLMTSSPSHEEIAFCAFLIFEREGCIPGREAEHWRQAELQLHAMRLHEEARAGAARAPEEAAGPRTSAK